VAEKVVERKVSEFPCCPELSQEAVCDTLNFRYRLPFRQRVGDDSQRIIPVEVILHFRLERCSGPLVIGDPVYSTTLLPGERVRLFTSDRHTRWSYDRETDLSYRHETTSEESFYTAGMAQAVSDLSIGETGVSTSSYEESWAEGGGGASFSFLGIIEVGGGGGGGSYDAHSTSTFARSLSRHAESASRYVAASVRAKSATSIGEVQQRTHAEGESEAHYESASRAFHNPNKCHAVTYLFYKLNKLQWIRFKLVAIERRVEDAAAPTGAYQRVPEDTTGRVAVLPQAIPATSEKRLAVEQMARTSAYERRQAAGAVTGLADRDLRSAATLRVATLDYAREPIRRTLREAALEAVDHDLAEAGLLDLETGKPTERIIAELSWERKEVLPTPGVLVKGCLDECNTCEPTLRRKIELDLERKALKNKLLRRQIELLEQAQEYRCCPGQPDEDE
jgi:hypothetical protein